MSRCFFQYFVFSSGVISSFCVALFRSEKTKRRMAKTSHPSMVHNYRNQELKLFSILLALNQVGIKFYSHITLSASIAQWLGPRPSDLVVVASSPVWVDIHVPAILWSRTSWQIKAMSGTSRELASLSYWWSLVGLVNAKLIASDRYLTNINIKINVFI